MGVWRGLRGNGGSGGAVGGLGGGLRGNGGSGGAVGGLGGKTRSAPPPAPLQAMQVTVSDPHVVALLFQPVELRCSYQSSATTPPIVTWKYKSFCPTTSGSSQGGSTGGWGGSESSMDAATACPDSARTVRIVATKQGSSVSVGEFYQGRSVTISDGRGRGGGGVGCDGGGWGGWGGMGGLRGYGGGMGCDGGDWGLGEVWGVMGGYGGYGGPGGGWVVMGRIGEGKWCHGGGGPGCPQPSPFPPFSSHSPPCPSIDP